MLLISNISPLPLSKLGIRDFVRNALSVGRLVFENVSRAPLPPTLPPTLR